MIVGGIEFLGRPGVLVLFLILHLLTGALMPYRAGQRPLLWTLMERAGAEMERRLNRAGRTPQDLVMRGLVAVILMGVLGFMLGFAVDRIAVHPFGWLAQVAFLSAGVSVMGTLKLLREVIDADNKKDAARAVAAMQPFFAEDLSKVDRHTIMRRALELSAQRLCRYLFAPGLYFLLLGGKLLALYVTLSAVFMAFDTPEKRSRPFARAARGVDAFLQFIPARAVALSIAGGALFVSRANPWRSLATAAGQAGRHPLRARGWLTGALAGALDVTLAGADGANWIGPENSSAKVTAADVQRGAMLHFVVFILVLLLASFAAAGFHFTITDLPFLSKEGE